jgi:hypothetical protein
LTDPPGADPLSDRPRVSPLAVEPISLKPAQRAAAAQAWDAATVLLESGAQGAGLVLLGELLRAVHSCRLASLPRLSSAGLRVAQHLRDLQAQRPEFRLEALAADFHELLRTANTLRTAESAAPIWIGTARRTYAPVGSLRVAGLFTEAIASSAGYAGVVTYVCDQDARIWSIADVAPGGAERAREAYATPVDLGDASFDHRSLARSGLHLQHATAAGNHRLGSGRGVGAVGADGRAWTEPPLADLWSPSLEAQLDRAWFARDSPFDERRAGDDLLFLRGTVIGARHDALELRVGGVAMSALAPSAHAELAYRHNLRLLAAAPGLQLLLIGRIAFNRPGTFFLLAIAPAGGASQSTCFPLAPPPAAEPSPSTGFPPAIAPAAEPSPSTGFPLAPAPAAEASLVLPAAWGGRVNLGLDQLQAAYVRGGGASGVAPALAVFAPGVDPLAPLRRRGQQVLLGGRASISGSTWSGVARDESSLQRNHLPTAAQLLAALRSAPQESNGAVRGDRLALAWLAARNYLNAASNRLQRLAWLRQSP